MKLAITTMRRHGRTRNPPRARLPWKIEPAPLLVSRRTSVTLAALVLLALAGSPSLAAAAEDPRTELESVRARIRDLTERLRETRRERDELAAELRETELAAAGLARELHAVEERADAQRARLTRLRAERRSARDAIDAQRAELARFARAAYALGRRDHLRILLSQEDPATLSRTLTYYAYFNRARARRIRALAAELERLAAIETKIARNVTELARLRETKLASRERLAAERRRRQAVIARLSDELGTQGTRLERLRENERRLEELVGELERELADIPIAGGSGSPFGTLKGKLPWPTAGDIDKRFGTPRGAGDLTWQGVLIDAPAGADVRAISHGRVAFAAWLRGFGMLMILEHGEGYMSLYGHNESLFKEVGDWVTPGEVIASIGDSGGRASSGLYFEIRHRGTPVDPTRWCRRGPPTPDTALVTP